MRTSNIISKSDSKVVINSVLDHYLPPELTRNLIEDIKTMLNILRILNFSVSTRKLIVL